MLGAAWKRLYSLGETIIFYQIAGRRKSTRIRLLLVSGAIALNEPNETLAPDMGDILLLQAQQELPPAGDLGVPYSDANGSIRVDGLDDENAASAASAARVLVGDSLVALDGQHLLNAADLSIAPLDNAPPDTVRLRALRGGGSYGQQRELEIPIALR